MRCLLLSTAQWISRPPKNQRNTRTALAWSTSGMVVSTCFCAPGSLGDLPFGFLLLKATDSTFGSAVKHQLQTSS